MLSFINLICSALLVTLATAVPTSDTSLTEHDGCNSDEYTQQITFYSGDYQFQMYVPVDGSVHNTTLDGPETNSLYCVHETGQCHDCFLYMNAVEVVHKGHCLITIEDLTDSEWVDYDVDQSSGVVSVIPGPPWQVKCDHPLKLAESADNEEVKARAAGQKTTDVMDHEKRNDDEEHDTDAYQKGCKQSEYSQKVVFYSDYYEFSMYVPVDGKTYKTGLTNDEDTLICATTWGTCQDCFLEMDHIEVTNPGSCKILMENFETREWTTYNVAQSTGKLAIPKSIPWEITCTHPLRTDQDSGTTNTTIAAREETFTSYCPDYDGQYITLTTQQNDQYILPVPANGTTFHVGDDYDQRDHIGCIGPIGSKYSQCLPCDEQFISISVSPFSKTCGFFIEGYQERIAISSTMGTKKLPQPAKIFYVTCGLDS